MIRPAHRVFWLAMVSAWTSLLAIPTQIGGLFNNGAGNPAHLPVEEWFRNAKNWQPGAELPGPWTPVSGQSNEMRLDDPGSIFGLAARSVTVKREQGSAISEIAVEYDKSASKSGPLIKSLARNVGLATGATTPAKQGADQVFEGKEYSVKLHPESSGGATATITRKKA